MFKSIISNYAQKIKGIPHQVYAQMVFVFVAFGLMVITSYMYVSNIERQHLKHVAEDVLAYGQANIAAELLEPETTLGVVSETIYDMIMKGHDSDSVQEYIRYINNYMWSGSNKRMSGVIGFYGVFDVFDGKFLTGAENWDLPDVYDPSSRPWYSAAIEAEGDIGVTQPYIDTYTNEASITFSRCIFDEQGTMLGIVALDILLDRIRSHTIETRISKDSYGILFNSNFEVIAHPNPAYWGRELKHMNDGVALETAIRQGEEISEYRSSDYRGQSSVLFVRQITNGWYLALVTPEKTYYKSVQDIAFLLSVIGVLSAIVLNIALMRMAAAKNASDIKSRQKSNFLATMSHEIRTPMNAILGIAEIQMQNKAIPADIYEALGKIYNSGYSLLAIINDILDFSKIEAGKLELLPVKYDVASLINDTVHLNMMRIGSKPIKFKLEIEPSIQAELFGDELRIKQILNNLLSNAFKYTESGEVVLSIASKLENDAKIPHVMLSFIVRDTGQGMTTDQVRKLFEEYSRFNAQANRVTEGTGLGMSITKHMVELMKGSIFVESEPGKGSIFTVLLPQGITGLGVLGEETIKKLQEFRFSGIPQMKMAQIVREPMPYGNVLVVDDVETNLYVAKGLLSPYGLTIDFAESGFEAIDKVREGSEYDIIFMDHMMPKMDGVEAAKIIRGLGYTHPIVALTANAIAGQAEQFLSNGFDDFISKPIDIRELNAVLNKLVRDKQSPKIIEAAQKNNNRDKYVAEISPQPVIPDLGSIFIRDAKKAITALETLYETREALDDNAIQSYIINVHAMKSALANIGEAELSENAERLETAGREFDIVAISAETPAFLEDLQRLVIRLTPKDKGGGDTSSMDDLDYLQEKLIVFRAACVVYDKKTAKEAIIDLKKKSWSRPIKDLINTLTEHLLHSEFEDAANIARDYDFNS